MELEPRSVCSLPIINVQEEEEEEEDVMMMSGSSSHTMYYGQRALNVPVRILFET